jgi:hypothetical protein
MGLFSQMAEENDKRTLNSVSGPSSPASPKVTWDDSSMRTSYANVVNATSTREEITLLFGANMTWNSAETKSFNVRLNDRIMLSPYAAKRLLLLLSATIKEYETRFGVLAMDLPGVETRNSQVERSNGAAP